MEIRIIGDETFVYACLQPVFSRMRDAGYYDYEIAPFYPCLDKTISGVVSKSKTGILMVRGASMLKMSDKLQRKD